MNKIVAVYLGPPGLALIGQFQNFASIVSGIGNASIQTGIVTSTAENDDPQLRKTVWSNALLITTMFSLITTVSTLVFAGYIASHILLDSNLIIIVQVFAISIIFYSLNLYLLSILNGLGEIGYYSFINILISVFTLILVSVLTIYFKLNGALLGIIFAQSLIFFISYFIIYSKYKNRFFQNIFSGIDKAIIFRLLKYGLTSFLSGFIFSFMMIAIRLIIIKERSLNDAGLREAAIKISIYFNMIFTLPVSIYFLPKLSGVTDEQEIILIFKEFFKLILPVAILSAYIIYLLRAPLISILFTESFILVNELLIYLLIAELFRIFSNLICVFFLAHKLLFKIIRNQFLLATIFILLTYFTIEMYGLEGVVISYLLASLLDAVLYILMFFSYYKNIQNTA